MASSLRTRSGGCYAGRERAAQNGNRGLLPAAHLKLQWAEVPFDEVVAHLESIGYQKRDPVEMVGEFSVRGGILDAFSPESPRPVRIGYNNVAMFFFFFFGFIVKGPLLIITYCSCSTNKIPSLLEYRSTKGGCFLEFLKHNLAELLQVIKMLFDKLTNYFQIKCLVVMDCNIPKAKHRFQGYC